MFAWRMTDPASFVTVTEPITGERDGTVSRRTRAGGLSVVECAAAPAM